MNRFGIKSALICVLLAVTASSARTDAEITVEVAVDRDSIGLDERATLTVVVSGPSQNLPSPQLTTLPMFDIYSQGRSTNISISNGKVSGSNTYRYLMMPKKAGTFPIDKIAVVYKNKRYVGNSVELTVLNKGSTVSEELEEKAAGSRGQSKDYFLETVVDKKNPYVNEQVTLTMKFYIAVQFYGSPELTEPTTTGFWTELLGNKAHYFQRINGRRYRVIERKYALFPTHAGDLTIGKASIRTTIADRGKRYRDPFDALGGFLGRGVEVTAHSQPIRVNVKPLPAKGRPDDFSGTIGRFSLETIADKRSVEVNQPVTVTIKISGSGNIKSVAEPVIPDLPDFRVYRASRRESLNKHNDLIGGTKIYEEVFIPKRPGKLVIPSISFNYFDPGTGKYKRTSTKPIKISVTKSEGYSSSAEIPYSGSDMTIGSSARGIRYIKEEIGETSEPGQILLFSPLYLVVNGLPVLLLAGLVVVRKQREKTAGDIGYARSRAAGRAARKKLTRARSLAEVSKAEEFYAEISSALTSFVADKLNISRHGLTLDQISKLLLERGAQEEAVNLVVEVLKKCDYARFAPSSITQDDINSSLQDASNSMISLEGVKFV